ncbi:MAG: putative rane protein [Anaerocolumna sp.]|nr:putative rane protein [Anaerocolumna sp.]
MEGKILLVIAGICIILFVIGLIKKRYDLLVNFGLRLTMGILGIYLLNSFLGNFGLLLEVGANGYNALIVGLFGVPGFVLVYGLAAYYHFI